MQAQCPIQAALGTGWEYFLAGILKTKYVLIDRNSIINNPPIDALRTGINITAIAIL